MANLFVSVGRWALPLLGLAIVLFCTPPLLRRQKAAPSEAYLLNAVNHDKLPLPRCENSIGRSKRCDIMLNYASVSRSHAVIARRKDGWVLFDTGSQLGTKLDGLSVSARAPLAHGQTITFGSFEFLFCDPEEERLGMNH